MARGDGPHVAAGEDGTRSGCSGGEEVQIVQDHQRHAGR